MDNPPSSFSCPHNSTVTILRECPITECPFHAHKVTEIFDLPAGPTCCVYYDSTLMSNVSPSRTQISALSRNSAAKISSKAVRSLYEDAMGHMRTLYALTHNSPTGERACRSCGYPLSTGNCCVSHSLCAQRRDWVSFVISLYRVDNTPIMRQLVWESFIRNEVACPPNTQVQGVELLSARDGQRYELHRKEKAGAVP